MNRTETAYSILLEAQKRAGEIVDYRFEAIKFRLADKTFYTPDFLVVRADGELELVDVKGGGGWEEDARVKIKVTAETFPMFHWVGAKQTRAGRAFTREEFS